MRTWYEVQYQPVEKDKGWWRYCERYDTQAEAEEAADVKRHEEIRTRVCRITSEEVCRLDAVPGKKWIPTDTFGGLINWR